MHERFKRKVFIFKSDVVSNLAKWLVRQSPYTVPDNLEKILKEFNDKLPYDFTKNKMVLVDLSTMTKELYQIMETIPDLMALNERKNGRDDNMFVSRMSKEADPDDDFIDIMAVCQNITCEFADKEDVKCYLNLGRELE